MKKFDAVVIGFGKGGKTLAYTLASNNQKVALVEKSKKMYGGTCINVGCIPTKSFVESCLVSKKALNDLDSKLSHYRESLEEKNRLTSMLNQKNYEKLASHENIEVIDAIGSFVDKNTIKLTKDDGTTEEIFAQKVFINTGASSFVPPVKGLKESRFSLTSDTLLDLQELPKRLAIIGGGYIGVEFSSIYANYGSEVTIIQDTLEFLPREDAEVAAEVLKSLEDRGIEIVKSAKVLEVVDSEKSVDILYEVDGETQRKTFDKILVATGRRPNVSALKLENAGVELTPRGAIKVDEHLRTSVDNIWALGDVTGSLQFTYISLDDFRIVKSQLLGDSSRTTENRGAVPYSVFIDPPFSRVGMSEKEALEKGYEVKVAKLKAAAIPKAHVVRNTVGMLKVVVDAKTDLILGAHLFCEESHEIVNILKLAIDTEVKYTVLRDNIYTHPTMAESLNDLLATIK